MIRWWWSPALWSGIGLTGQVLFGSRFLVQWIASALHTQPARQGVVQEA